VPSCRRTWLLQPDQFSAGLGQLAPHDQALEEIDGLGKGGAGGIVVAAQVEETGEEKLGECSMPAILKTYCSIEDVRSALRPPGRYQ
jgi:hypothetical protein